MITNDGSLHIKRYLAGLTPTIAQSIGLGVGTYAASKSDERLQFEISRAEVSLVSYDFVNDCVVFKATLPDDFSGKVYEVSIFSSQANAVSSGDSSGLLVTFDSDGEDWSVVDSGEESSFASENTRIATESLRQLSVTSTTSSDTLSGMSFDLSGYSGSDKFLFAYHVSNANTSALQFRFLSDSSNYYDFTLGAQTSGYKIASLDKASAVPTGSPDWASIIEIQVSSTAAGGTGIVDFDGIRIEDVDTFDPNSVMIAREILATPFSKVEGKVQEVEFSLEVNV